jgi:hypothetical protein
MEWHIDVDQDVDRVSSQRQDNGRLRGAGPLCWLFDFVNTPPPKGGGFKLRLKAGLVRLRRTWVTLKVIVWFG